MNIVRNGDFIPHQAIVYTRKSNLHDFMIEKVNDAYKMRQDCLGKDNAIWEIEIHPTNKCNLNCLGCSYSTRHNSKSLSIKQVISFLKAYEKYDLKSVFFSGGGDPLLWEYWDDFFSLVKKSFSVGISTNMYNFSSIKHFWKRFDFFQIHITGFDETSSKKETGINSFKQIDDNINFLLKNRTQLHKITLKLLVNQNNYTLLPKYLSYIVDKKADSIVLKFQQDFLHNNNLASEGLIKEIREMSYSHPIANEYDFLLDNLDDIIFNTYPQLDKCIFANSGLYRLINADGDVFPCIAANRNKNNKLSSEYSCIDIYSSEMLLGHCPLKACRHYRFGQYISMKNSLLQIPQLL